MYKQTDEMVWLSCLQGNMNAFEELYKRYYSTLYNYGKKIISNEELVKDCLQNFFVKLIQNYETLSSSISVKGYMLKAFRNTLYNALRAKNERIDFIAFSSDDFFSVTEEKDDIPNDSSEDYSDNCRVVREAFHLLSSRQQEILYLYYVLEFSHTDIADTLNINYQSSKNLLFRSLAKLKESYFELKKAPLKETINKDIEPLPSHIDKDYPLFHLEIAK